MLCFDIMNYVGNEQAVLLGNINERIGFVIVRAVKTDIGYTREERTLMLHGHIVKAQYPELFKIVDKLSLLTCLTIPDGGFLPKRGRVR